MSNFENKGFQRLPVDEENEDGGSNQAPPQAPPYQPPQPYYDDPNRGPQAWVPATQFVVAPTAQTMSTIHDERPTDWTGPAIFVCIFCFWPTGILAITYANKANEFAAMGNMDEARQNARTAKILTIASLVVGLLAVVASILVAVIPMVN